MTETNVDDALKTMAERFLAWKLPDDFNPDGGISFTPLSNVGTPFEYKHQPTGTNLLNYTQAIGMLTHITRGLAITDDTRELTDEERQMVDDAWETHKAAGQAHARRADAKGRGAASMTITEINDAVAKMTAKA